MRSRNIAEKLTKWMVLTAAVGLVMLAGAPTAQALPDDPFEPKLSVKMDHPIEPYIEDGWTMVPGATPNLTAGAQPDLVLEIEKPLNECPPPYESNNQCELDQLAMQQNFKKMDISFPPGLMADVNAAPYCDPKKVWEWDVYMSNGSDGERRSTKTNIKLKHSIEASNRREKRRRRRHTQSASDYVGLRNLVSCGGDWSYIARSTAV